LPPAEPAADRDMSIASPWAALALTEPTAGMAAEPVADRGMSTILPAAPIQPLADATAEPPASLAVDRGRSATPSSGTSAVTAAADPAWPPERVSRSCVASLCDSATFAKIVAQEAYARHFFAARRRAFLGDGQKYNGSIQQQWFKDFEPIADFIHPLCYLY